MKPRQGAAQVLVAATALAFGFLLASQLRLQLVPSGNRVAQNAALVRSVERLEATNAADRRSIARLNAEIASLEAEAALRSQGDQQMAQRLGDLRAHAGLTRLDGPGVKVRLGAAGAGSITFIDIQDVVNLLFQAGAEGIAVDGERVAPITAFKGSGSDVVIDQGPPLGAPFTIVAVGDRNQMEAELNDPSELGDLRHRQALGEASLTWSGSPGLELPAYQGALTVEYARAR